jgi:DNA-binding CsgD family transcriptional regulator
MRRKAPDGLTAIERAILARLKKGPAALSSLAHAARCKSSSIKVHISRLRKKLPCGIMIPKSMYGYLTYSLETSKTDAPLPKPGCCKTETGIESAKPAKNAGPGKQGNTKRNNMLYVSEVLTDYTLCELTLRQAKHYKNLAWATLLRSWYVCGAKWGTA